MLSVLHSCPSMSSSTAFAPLISLFHICLFCILSPELNLAWHSLLPREGSQTASSKGHVPALVCVVVCLLPFSPAGPVTLWAAAELQLPRFLRPNGQLCVALPGQVLVQPPHTKQGKGDECGRENYRVAKGKCSRYSIYALLAHWQCFIPLFEASPDSRYELFGEETGKVSVSHV